jgi:ankyrin repeat protein
MSTDNHQQRFWDALQAGDVDSVRSLLQANSSLLHSRTDDELAPLLFAANENLVEIVGLLLQIGADVNMRDPFGNTALHYALQHHPADCARMLIEHRADVNVRNNDGEQPIHFAAIYDNAQGASLVLDRGSDVNALTAKGWSPIHYAAWHGSPEAAFVLSVRGADLGARDQEHFTPLFHSLRHHGARGWTVIGLLLYQGAKLDILSAIGLGMTHVVRCFLKGDPALLQLEPNAMDFVALATALGNVELIQTLLDCGAEVNACQNYRLPLIEAMQGRKEEQAINLLRLLLKYGANPTFQPAKHEESALEWAEKHAPSYIPMLLQQR